MPQGVLQCIILYCACMDMLTLFSTFLDLIVTARVALFHCVCLFPLDQVPLKQQPGNPILAADAVPKHHRLTNRHSVLQGDEVFIKFSHVSYTFDTGQLASSKVPVRLTLSFSTNITARVNLTFAPPPAPIEILPLSDDRSSSPSGPVDLSGTAREVGGQGGAVREGPVLLITDTDLVQAALMLSVPVLVLAVAGILLTIVTLWRLPMLKACLMPLDKRNALDGHDHDSMVSSMGGVYSRGGTYTAGHGKQSWWSAGGLSVEFGDVPLGRSLVGTAFSRATLNFRGVFYAVPVRKSSACGLGRHGPERKSKWAEFERSSEYVLGQQKYNVVLDTLSGEYPSSMERNPRCVIVMCAPFLEAAIEQIAAAALLCC